MRGRAVEFLNIDLRACGDVVQGPPHVLVDPERLVGAPAKTAAEEGGEEEDAVDELALGAGKGEFVEEPVEVEEGRGELVEDEGRGVVVDEWALATR